MDVKIYLLVNDVTKTIYGLRCKRGNSHDGPKTQFTLYHMESNNDKLRKRIIHIDSGLMLFCAIVVKPVYKQ